MKDSTKSFFITIAAFFVVMIITHTASFGANVELDKDITLPDILGILTSFMILTLVVERFADVVITGPREFEKIALLESISAKEQKSEDVTDLKQQLNNFRSETRKTTMQLNLFLGLIIGFAGYRILSALTGSIDNLEVNQKLMFHTVDILLTAGLVAGGSKGINVISKSMRDWFKPAKDA